MEHVRLFDRPEAGTDDFAGERVLACSDHVQHELLALAFALKVDQQEQPVRSEHLLDLG